MQKDNIVETTTKGWDKSKFLDGLFDYIKPNKDYNRNPQKSDKGTTRYLRRWKVGEQENRRNGFQLFIFLIYNFT